MAHSRSREPSDGGKWSSLRFAWIAGHVATTQVAACFAFWLTAAFLALLIALHLFEPQFNSSGHMISEYELGRYGWMMRLAFVCLGGGSLALSLALSPRVRTRIGHTGQWWLFLIGIAFIGAGAFTPDSIGLSAHSIQAYIHGICGLVVIFSSPIAITLLDRSVIQSQRSAQHTTWPTVLVWAGFVSFYLSAVAFTIARQHDAAWDLGTLASVSNRLMIATYCIWVMITALKARESIAYR